MEDRFSWADLRTGDVIDVMHPMKEECTIIVVIDASFVFHEGRVKRLVAMLPYLRTAIHSGAARFL